MNSNSTPWDARLSDASLARRRDSKQRTSERFIRRIPLDWALQATALPGQALAVGAMLWFRAGLSDCRTVRMPYRLLGQGGVSTHTARRALRALEAAGLVSVAKEPGKSPIVTLLL